MQNLEAWGTYFVWLVNDHQLKGLERLNVDIQEKLAFIQGCFFEEVRLEEKKFSSKRQKKRMLVKLKNEIHLKRSQLQILLINGYHAIAKLKNSLNYATEQFCQVELFCKILASQLKLPKAELSRGHEQLLIQLLNMEMKVTAAVNCRSGLDRTGFLRSMIMNLEKTRLSFKEPHRLMKMAYNWEELTRSLNLASSIKGRTRQLLKTHKAAYDVMEFRKAFLVDLLRIGLPITAFNTGYLGFKGQSGVYFNIVEKLIPLNFLPPKVNVRKDEKQKKVPLVKYDSILGPPIGLTKQGRQLLTPFSEMRGA
ncbi:hypothetical protein PHSC3_001855 [Chlamydiales bacterium STE3]|nr:hypothetical protein PHSC3_001855 [Chlamydiales bacterium STE3]